HEHRHGTAGIQPRAHELPELARVQRGRAPDPWIERIGRDRIERLAARREVVPAVVEAQLDVRRVDDAEVLRPEVFRRDLAHARLDLGDDDALDGRTEADGAPRGAPAETD